MTDRRSIRTAARNHVRPTVDPKVNPFLDLIEPEQVDIAGEAVRLHGEHQGTRYGNEWVYMEAFSTDDKRVGAVHLEIATVPGPA